jgi:hypothetical protein
MKAFTCACGQAVFFDSTHCTQCGSIVGYDPEAGEMLAFDSNLHRHCENRINFGVCNWLLAAQDPHPLCRSCRITRITPNLCSSENARRWWILESAKRRLLYSLLNFNLPIDADSRHNHPALAFEFLEDRSTNPLVAEEYVRTGHATGVITINVSEADDVQREITRSLMNESYRTPLGHCRHESGHYYYDRLVRNTDRYPEFREYFGDADIDYEAALTRYYANPPAPDPEAGYISLYARSHPLEDWAECWAHYLHIHDTLETATASGIISQHDDETDFDSFIHEWLRLSVILNELNRSMGLADAYPFVFSKAIVNKLRFIHSVVDLKIPS